MNTENMIHHARRHSYAMAEGFADVDIQTELPAHLADRLDEAAQELSRAAGVSVEVARSAIVEMALKEYPRT